MLGKNQATLQNTLFQLCSQLLLMFLLSLRFLQLNTSLIMSCFFTNEISYLLTSNKKLTVEKACMLRSYVLFEPTNTSEGIISNSCLWGRVVWELTCIFRRKPAWLNELKLNATVIKTAATVGVVAKFKQSNPNPGPMKPIDCC